MNIKKPPVVVVLGHIDHGKTTLLDTIRKTNTTSKEVGGITQSIGAYQVKLKTKNKKLETDTITFIDTPGHEAFSKMRSHGAKAADIALLVIAADEGVKPQTAEAIKDIKEEKLPFIVVLNKMDNPAANPQKVKEELTQCGVFAEGLGGDAPAVQISAKTGAGIKELLDLILLMAEVEELKANFQKPAEGVVIASSLDSKRGVVVTLLVKEGTLKEGERLKFQTTYGKARAMSDFEGKPLKEAGPSTPVRLLGIEELPETGEIFSVVKTTKEAKMREAPLKEKVVRNKFIVNDKVLKLIVKANEKASLDALQKLITQTQPQFPDIHFQIIEASAGDISLSTIELAGEFGAVILGFQVAISQSVRAILRQKNVQIKLFGVIYELPSIVEELAKKMFIQKEESKKTAKILVLAIFSKDKQNQVIGGKVSEGVLRKNSLLEIKRDDNILGKGKIINLQHKKKDVASVEESKECGMLFESDVEVKVGDALVEP